MQKTKRTKLLVRLGWLTVAPVSGLSGVLQDLLYHRNVHFSHVLCADEEKKGHNTENENPPAAAFLCIGEVRCHSGTNGQTHQQAANMCRIVNEAANCSEKQVVAGEGEQALDGSFKGGFRNR